MLARARELSARTLIFDVEPLVAWWDTSQQALDQGIAAIVAQLDQVPASCGYVIFATNSDPQALGAPVGARRPGAATSPRPGSRCGPARTAGCQGPAR